MKRRGSWNRGGGGGGRGGRQRDMFDKFQPVGNGYESERATRTLLVTGVTGDENSVMQSMSTMVKVVELFRDTVRGEEIALIDCETVEAAHEVVARTGGHMIVAGTPCVLGYSVTSAAEARMKKENPAKRKFVDDWDCPFCGTHNFAKRLACFRCNVERSQAELAKAQGIVLDTTNKTEVVVKGLPFKTTDEQLYIWASAYGLVREARVIRDKQTGASKGTGFVTFETPDGATTLMDEISSTRRRPVVDGREVNVEWAVGKDDKQRWNQQQQYYQQQQDQSDLQNWMYAAYMMAAAAASSSVQTPAATTESSNSGVSLSDSLSNGVNNQPESSEQKTIDAVLSSWDAEKDQSKPLNTTNADEENLDVDAALDDFYNEITESKSENISSTITHASEDCATTPVSTQLNESEQQIIPDTVCVICKRLLPSKSALERHYLQSKLHSFMLRKKRVESQTGDGRPPFSKKKKKTGFKKNQEEQQQHGSGNNNDFNDDFDDDFDEDFDAEIIDDLNSTMTEALTSKETSTEAHHQVRETAL